MRCVDVRRSGLAALILVCASVACSSEPAAPAAQPSAAAPAKEVATAAPPALAPGTGWIEGTLTDTNGVPPVIGGSLGVPIALKAEGGDLQSESHPTIGGGFSFRNLKPGVYELVVTAAHPPDGPQPLRPIHISGVIVEAGKRTVLNIKMQPGQELEEIGKPALTTQKFVIVSDELERLQAQIDELKKK